MVSVRPCSQIWVYQIVDFSRSRCAAAMKTTTDISRKKMPGEAQMPTQNRKPFCWNPQHSLEFRHPWTLWQGSALPLFCINIQALGYFPCVQHVSFTHLKNCLVLPSMMRVWDSLSSIMICLLVSKCVFSPIWNNDCLSCGPRMGWNHQELGNFRATPGSID